MSTKQRNKSFFGLKAGVTLVLQGSPWLSLIPSEDCDGNARRFPTQSLLLFLLEGCLGSLRAESQRGQRHLQMICNIGFSLVSLWFLFGFSLVSLRFLFSFSCYHHTSHHISAADTLEAAASCKDGTFVAVSWWTRPGVGSARLTIFTQSDSYRAHSRLEGKTMTLLLKIFKHWMKYHEVSWSIMILLSVLIFLSTRLLPKTRSS